MNSTVSFLMIETPNKIFVSPKTRKRRPDKWFLRPLEGLVWHTCTPHLQGVVILAHTAMERRIMCQLFLCYKIFKKCQ
jgi:hypothetical protein